MALCGKQQWAEGPQTDFHCLWCQGTANGRGTGCTLCNTRWYCMLIIMPVAWHDGQNAPGVKGQWQH